MSSRIFVFRMVHLLARDMSASYDRMCIEWSPGCILLDRVRLSGDIDDFPYLWLGGDM